MALFAKSEEVFLRGVLTLANGVPGHDTFSRLSRQLDPDAFRAAFQRLMPGLALLHGPGMRVRSAAPVRGQPRPV